MSGNIRKVWSSWGSSRAGTREAAPQFLPTSSTSCLAYSCSTCEGRVPSQKRGGRRAGAFLHHRPPEPLRDKKEPGRQCF